MRITERLVAIKDDLEAIASETANGGDGDIESMHSRADNLLCEALILLGRTEIVDAWIKVAKWYA